MQEGLFLPETAPPPMEKSRFSAVSRVFVLLLIALVAVSGLAGGVSAQPDLITLELTGGTYTGPTIPSGLNQGTGPIQNHYDPYDYENIIIKSENGQYYLAYQNISHQPEYQILNKSVLNREGYTFAGWSESENGDVLFDADGILNTNSQSSCIEQAATPTYISYTWNQNSLGQGITLYALWTPNGAYFKFEKNHADAVMSGDPEGRADSGDGFIRIEDDYSIPTLKGYSFDGWMLTSASEWEDIISDGELHPANNDVDEPYLELSSGNDVEENDISVKDGEWIIKTESYDATHPKILYASWYPNSTNIRFNKNADDAWFPCPDGIDSWDEDIDGLMGRANSGNNFLEAQEEYSEPKREGWTFKGWSLTPDGTKIIAKDYENAQDYPYYRLPITDDPEEDDSHFDIIDEYIWLALDNHYNGNPDVLNLYAVWDKIPEQPKNEGGTSSAIILIGSKSSGGGGPDIEYKYVTFNANGGLGEMAKQQFTPGQTKALNANQFTFEGKNFAGWALEPTGMVVYTNGQEIMLDEDITVYAVWVEPIPDTPAIPGADDETGIPTWLAVLIVAVILVILVAVLVYFLVIRRGAA